MVVGIDPYSRDLPEDESIRQLRPVVDNLVRRRMVVGKQRRQRRAANQDEYSQ